MTTLVFSLRSCFQPIIFLYLDELVFTGRPWCTIHVIRCHFLCVVVGGVTGSDITAGPWRGLCLFQRLTVLGFSFFSQSLVLILVISVKTKDCEGESFLPSEFWRFVVWLNGEGFSPSLSPLPEALLLGRAETSLWAMAHALCEREQY